MAAFYKYITLDVEWASVFSILFSGGVYFPSNLPTSCLLGCVDVVDVLPQEEYRDMFPEGESNSPYVFVCTNPQELLVKFPMQGQHKICKYNSLRSFYFYYNIFSNIFNCIKNIFVILFSDKMDSNIHNAARKSAKKTRLQ